MNNDLWLLACISLFLLAVQLCLSGRSQRSLDEASMLPFADDPEALREMQREQAEMRPGNRPGAGRLSA